MNPMQCVGMRYTLWVCFHVFFYFLINYVIYNLSCDLECLFDIVYLFLNRKSILTKISFITLLINCIIVLRKKCLPVN